MATNYTGVDLDRYNAGNKFYSQDRYLQGIGLDKPAITFNPSNYDTGITSQYGNNSMYGTPTNTGGSGGGINFGNFNQKDNLLTVLIDEAITKQGCFDILLEAGIKLPEIYSFGYPNANCIGCVKASSPTYWNLVRETFPNVFEQRMKLSEELGAKLVRYKGKRIGLTELPVNAKGRDLKSYDFECGVFCIKDNSHD